MALNSVYTFRALSFLGLFALWGVMMLNGSFTEMIATDLRGSFASGVELKKSWTGFETIDFLAGVLLVFFSSVINTADMPDLGPYIMSVDLIAALMVVNVMTVVEDRRNRKTGPLRSTSFWQTLWNMFGAGTVFPAYCYIYLKRRGKKTKPELISNEQAQALPWTAIWEILISLPLLLPTLLWTNSPLRIQYGIVVWGLAPYTLGFFQDFAGSIIASSESYKGVLDPTTLTYKILGTLSAVVHVAGGVVAPYFLPGVTWSRIYWPNHSITVPGPTLLIEGATMFCQYDYMVISLSVLALGFYMFTADPALAGKGKSGSAIVPTLKLIILTVLLGPGAGLAWLLCKKEERNKHQDSNAKAVNSL